MSFGKLGALGRGFGRMGGGGGTGTVFIPGVITAQKGTYTITGNDAGLIASHGALVAALGTYAVTGVAATLTYSGGASTAGQPIGLLLTLTKAA
jgi:hypothetical protein